MNTFLIILVVNIILTIATMFAFILGYDISEELFYNSTTQLWVLLIGFNILYELDDLRKRDNV